MSAEAWASRERRPGVPAADHGDEDIAARPKHKSPGRARRPGLVSENRLPRCYCTATFVKVARETALPVLELTVRPPVILSPVPMRRVCWPSWV